MELQGALKNPRETPKVSKRTSKWSQRVRQGVPKGSQDVPEGFQVLPEGSLRNVQRCPREPQGSQGISKGSPGDPKGSPRVTGRLWSRWNDGVAPKSAALRTSCERRVEQCLHIERLSASLTSWYDFSHTLRGLDRHNLRKLTTVQHFSMVCMVLRCRQRPRDYSAAKKSGALWNHEKSTKCLKSVVLLSIF